MATKTNSKNSVVFYGTDETDFLTNSGNNVTIISYAGNDIINVASSESSRYSNLIYAGAGDNFINNSNVMQSTIISGDGNDVITTGGYYSQIYAGGGNNRINIDNSYYYSVDNKSKYVFQQLRIRLKHFKVYRNFKRRSNITTATQLSPARAMIQ